MKQRNEFVPIQSTADRSAVGPRKVTLTLGEMAFTPIAYNSFRVGPISVELEIASDEDLCAIVPAEFEKLHTIFEAELVRVREIYANALKQNDSYLRGRK